MLFVFGCLKLHGIWWYYNPIIVFTSKLQSNFFIVEKFLEQPSHVIDQILKPAAWVKERADLMSSVWAVAPILFCKTYAIGIFYLPLQFISMKTRASVAVLFVHSISKLLPNHNNLWTVCFLDPK